MLLAILASPYDATAQAPEGINYQAVARDASGNALGDTTLDVTINISDDASMAIVLYSEEHSVTTNQFGLFTIIIGDGTTQTGTFSGIDWSGGNMFLNVEIGTLDMGTTQLMSVPYALFASNVANTAVVDSTKLIGTDLIIYFGGDSTQTDLSSLATTSTDTISSFSLIGDSLRIIEGGDTFFVDASTINTDNQSLSFSNDTLKLQNGGTVFLGNLNTDEQTLSLNDDTLFISNGNNVILPDADASNELVDSIVVNGTDLELYEAASTTPVVVNLSSFANSDTSIVSGQLNGSDLELINNVGQTIAIDITDILNDTSASNELITGAVLSGTDLEITDAGGTNTVDLAPLVGTDTNIVSGQLNGTDLELVNNEGQTIAIDITDILNDTSASNELITGAVLSGTDLEITDAGGTNTVDLAPLVGTDTNIVSGQINGTDLELVNNEGQTIAIDITDILNDTSASNEIQVLSLNSTTSVLSLSNGGGSVSIDTLNTNELQDLSINVAGDSLLLSDGDGVAISALQAATDTLPLIAIDDSNRAQIFAGEFRVTLNNDHSFKVLGDRINMAEMEDNNIYFQTDHNGNWNLAFSSVSSIMSNPSTTYHNFVYGRDGGRDLSDGEYNTLLGWRAAQELETGDDNIVIGRQAYQNSLSGSDNIVLGRGAGFQLTGGSNNILIGEGAGGNVSATTSGTIKIGGAAGANDSIDNRLYIDNSSTASPLIGGDFGANILQVGGTFRTNNLTGDTLTYPTADGDANYVIKTDGFGTLSFVDPAALVSGDNLGDHVLDSNLRTNGSYISFDGDDEGIYVTNDGKVGIGTNSPDATLSIRGFGVTGAAIDLTNSGGTGTTWSLSSSTNGQFRIVKVPGSTYTALSIDSLNGNVGIGTISADSLLDVDGGARMKALNINDEYSFPTNAPTLNQVMQYDGSDVVWTTPAGNDTVGLQYVLGKNSDANGDSINNVGYFSADSAYIDELFVQNVSGDSIGAPKGRFDTLTISDSLILYGMGFPKNPSSGEVLTFSGSAIEWSAPGGDDDEWVNSGANDIKATRNVAIGDTTSLNFNGGQQNGLIVGDNIDFDGSNSQAFGEQIDLTGDRSSAKGFRIDMNGDRSHALGSWIDISNDDAFVIGGGINLSNPLSNSISQSIMFGYNSTIPTMTIRGGTGAGTLGMVGIGTTAPTNLLSIAGAMDVDTAIIDTLSINGLGFPNSGLNPGDVLSYDGTSLNWSPIAISSDGDWDTSATAVYNTTKNIGIGLTNPTSNLHVTGTNDFTITAINTASAGTGDQKAVFADISGGNTSNDNYALYGEASGSGNDNIGVFGSATGAAGTKYGVYGTASGSGTRYSGYFDGAHVYIDENLGINNPTPGRRLSIGGDLEADSAFLNQLTINANYSLPTTAPGTGDVMTYDGTNVVWTAPGGSSDSDWDTNAAGSIVYNENDSISIGTSLAAARFNILTTDSLGAIISLNGNETNSRALTLTNQNQGTGNNVGIITQVRGGNANLNLGAQIFADSANLNYGMLVGAGNSTSTGNASSVSILTAASSNNGNATGIRNIATSINGISAGDSSLGQSLNAKAYGTYTQGVSATDTAIGIYAAATTATGTAYSAYFDEADVFVSQDLGIGVTNPAHRLDVAGSGQIDSIYTSKVIFGSSTDMFEIVPDNWSAGDILTMNASGKTSWETPAVTPGSPFEYNIAQSVLREDTSQTTGSFDADFVIGSATLNYDGTNYTRMFFDKGKGAIRAGASVTRWEADSVGNYSAAFGENTVASGTWSFAAGRQAYARGDYATAFGYFSDAKGDYAMALGFAPAAIGDRSVALGDNAKAEAYRSLAYGNFATAEADRSIAIGNSVTAQSYQEISLGSYPTLYTAGSTTAWDTTDRIFNVGFGTHPSTDRRDALTILKSGKVGIRNNAPSYNLDVTGTIKADSLILTNGVQAGMVLHATGDGGTYWDSASVDTVACPTGYTNVNKDYCIQTDSNTADSWFDAVMDCNGQEAKLPSWAEWYAGVQASGVTARNTSVWEWIDSGTSNNAQRVGGGGNDATSSMDSPVNTNAYRCIYYKR